MAFIAAIAAGTLLPLMDLVFGKFVTAFNGFATGSVGPGEYRSQVNKYTYEVHNFVLDKSGTNEAQSLLHISVRCQVCLRFHTLGKPCQRSLYDRTLMQTGTDLHICDSHHKSTTHRLHQAHIAAKHRLLRLGRSRFCHCSGYHEREQRQQWHLREAHSHHTRHIDLRDRFRCCVRNFLEAYTDYDLYRSWDPNHHRDLHRH